MPVGIASLGLGLAGSNNDALSSSNPHRLTGIRSLVPLLRDIISSPQFWDGLKVFGIGAAIAGSKWVAETAFEAVKSLFTARAVLRGGEESTLWVLSYLEEQGGWAKNGRDVEVQWTGRKKYRGEGESDEKTVGEKSQWMDMNGVTFVPAEKQAFRFKFQGHFVWVTRERALVGDTAFEESLTLTFLTLSPSIIAAFLSHCRAVFQATARKSVRVLHPDRYQRWTEMQSVPRRRITTLHLPAGVKENILSDARFFLSDSTRRWYEDRGIPYRRGYLLHGPPGTGKTSLAHALASELELSIYQINLNARNMDDSSFSELMSDIPAHSLIVLEDVDAAFVSRIRTAPDSTTPDDGVEGPSTKTKQQGYPAPTSSVSGSSSISFSTLLNCLDGLTSSSGRILILTTNHVDRLDAAMIRPGRIEKRVPFFNAEPAQCEELFQRWFSPGHTSSSTRSRSRSDNADLQQRATATMTSAEKSSLNNNNNDVNVDVDVIDPITSSATLFASSIPPRRFSIAALQSYLLETSAKGLSPSQAAEGVKDWIQSQSQSQSQEQE